MPQIPPSVISKPVRRKVWLKALLWLLALLIVVIAVCEAVGWYFLRGPAEKLLSEKLQRTVRIEAPFKLHLLGRINLESKGLWIGLPEAFTSQSGPQHFVDARGIALTLSYFDLLSFQPEEAFPVKALRVADIDVNLLRHQDGQSSWQFPSEDNTKSSPPPRIATLVVTNGKLLLDDKLTQSNINIRFDTKEDATDRQNTISHLAAKGTFRQRPLKGELTTHGFLPIATQKANSPPIDAKAWLEFGGIRLDFNGNTSDIFGKQNINGDIVVKGTSLGLLGDLLGTPLPTTDPFRLAGQVRKQDMVWIVGVHSATVGRSKLSAELRYDPQPERPMLSGVFKGASFYLADLAPAFGTRNQDGSQAPTRKDGRVIPNRPIDLPSLSKMDADITVNLDYVELGNAFNKPISPLNAKLTLQDSELKLSDIDARTADGSLGGMISLNARQAARWKIDLTWKNIDLAKWLQISQDRKAEAAKQGKPAPAAYVTGTLNGRTNLSGNGQSTADLLSSLDGDITLFIRDGSISHLIVEVLGLDVAQSLTLLIGGDSNLPMQCAVMDIKSTKGVLKPDVAVIDTPVTMVLINGDINLATEQLNLRLAAKPKNISPFTARSPIRVTGPFSAPNARPEGGPIAARLLGSVALAFVNPLAAILPFIDAGSSNDKPSPCADTLGNFKKPAK